MRINGIFLYSCTDAYRSKPTQPPIKWRYILYYHTIKKDVYKRQAYTKALSDKVGAIPEGTDIKTYVDDAIGSGGTSSAEAIAKAKSEAISASKTYTDEAIAKAHTVTEF